jgi:hypothetical protein
MTSDSKMRNFDPLKIAYYEKENWVAYYKKQWLRLLFISVSMVKYAFGLTWAQAIYAAYWVARAEIAFAPYPINDIPKAENYMRRFYLFLKGVHGESFDVDKAAKLEIHWWVVHRHLFANADNQELVDALADLYAQAYDVSKDKIREAAYHRAAGMLYSDRWVNEGKRNDSLLAYEEGELVRSYTALRDAVQVEMPHPAVVQVG